MDLAKISGSRVSECDFSAVDVLEILRGVDLGHVSARVAYKPAGCSVFVYDYTLADSRDDWVADDYRWINNGTDKLPRRQPLLCKCKFKAFTADKSGSIAFRRIAFTALDDPMHVIVQYVGDESVATSVPHGNDKRVTPRPYERSVPSVLLRLARQVQSSAPSIVHKEAVAAATTVADVPCEYKQVHNVRDHVKASQQLSKDGLTILHVIAYDTPDFAHHVYA